MRIPDAACGPACAVADEVALNRTCGCAVLDVGALRARLLDDLDIVFPDATAYDGLFSPYAVFVDGAHLDTMAAVAAAVFAIASSPGYAETVLAWAPQIARLDPGSPGGVLGLDFHLTVDGPRLIEVNTNPGGLLLNALVADHAAGCAPANWRPPMRGEAARAKGVDAWIDDLALQLGRRPTRIAIVDEQPRSQFLYPEFQLYAEAFRAGGIDAVIHAPDALRYVGGTLSDDHGTIDAVYNRLTDFALQTPGAAALADAYRGSAVALSPHPRAHALFADKRNLAVLGDANRVAGFGLPEDVGARLQGVVPPTVPVTDANRDRLWAQRDALFFKPAAGFGSRGSYRGDKLTRRVWAAIAESDYVAQALVPPSLRIAHEGTEFKVDVRCYASAHEPLLFAARLYRGQTTNMRTAGGGFAVVMTSQRALRSGTGDLDGVT